MVRNYKPKTDRGKADGNLMKRAVEEVTEGKSIREVSRTLDIDRTTLSRYVKKFQAGQVEKTTDYTPKYNTRQVGVRPKLTTDLFELTNEYRKG